MFKKFIRVGDSATIHGETRKVTALKKNLNGSLIIIWASDHTNNQVGGCTPSLWSEWASDADLKRRRF